MKRVPKLETDTQAESFLKQDLSDLDYAQFKSMSPAAAQKMVRLNVRMPTALLDVVRARAKAAGMPYSRYVRMVLEADVACGR